MATTNLRAATSQRRSFIVSDQSRADLHKKKTYVFFFYRRREPNAELRVFLNRAITYTFLLFCSKGIFRVVIATILAI